MGLVLCMVAVVAFPIGRVLASAFLSLVALACVGLFDGHSAGVGSWTIVGIMTVVFYLAISHALHRADQRAVASVYRAWIEQHQQTSPEERQRRERAARARFN